MKNHHYLHNQSPSSDIVRLRTNGKAHTYLDGALSGLRQFLATEMPLKLMKNVVFLFHLSSSFRSQDI